MYVAYISLCYIVLLIFLLIICFLLLLWALGIGACKMTSQIASWELGIQGLIQVQKQHYCCHFLQSSSQLMKMNK